MFKFGFGSHKAKRGLKVPKGVHILQEYELEQSVGGGTPTRQMLYSVGAPEWLHTAIGTEANYSRYTQMFPSAPWQSGVSWETPGDMQQSNSYSYYDG